MDQDLPSVGFKFFFSIINCIGSMFLVAAVQYWAVIAAIPLLIVFITLGMYYTRTTRELKRLEASSRSPVFSHLNETLQGLTSIQCFKAEDRFKKTFYRYYGYIMFFPLISNHIVALNVVMKRFAIKVYCLRIYDENISGALTGSPCSYSNATV